MSNEMLSVCYIGASVLFILSLGGLSHQETARRGNAYGILGMALALIATVIAAEFASVTELALAGAVGCAIGVVMALRVAMTQMPQLVAMLNSLVGLAAVLVALASLLEPPTGLSPAEKLLLDGEIFVSALIGIVTFTGSMVAFAKLHGILSGKPLLLPARNLFNVVLLVSLAWFGYEMLVAGGMRAPSALGGSGAWLAALDPPSLQMALLLLTVIIGGLLGVHMVLAIGGADMPVVVSVLNSYSGWAAAATGFMLGNDLLIVTGALVGSSGAILSYIMCRAMNRSIWNVVLGGFGTESSSGTGAYEGEAVATSADEAAQLLSSARNVVVVPGYGMAVSQAQDAVKGMIDALRGKGVNVRFAIHPVAGRLPGHMNVLLADARIPYDIVLEMDDINEDFPETDAVLVIGANDIVNPAAAEDAGSPIAGMPVLEVWKARAVIVLKRSMASGYAGVDNPLFFKDNTRMLFGDARESVQGLVTRVSI